MGVFNEPGLQTGGRKSMPMYSEVFRVKPYSAGALIRENPLVIG